jgi:hypothetical protein
MMDFHVITPTEQQLVMQTTDGGDVAQVLPAPVSSLPAGAAPAPAAPGK